MMRVCIWFGLYWVLSSFFDHYIQSSMVSSVPIIPGSFSTVRSVQFRVVLCFFHFAVPSCDNVRLHDLVGRVCAVPHRHDACGATWLRIASQWIGETNNTASPAANATCTTVHAVLLYHRRVACGGICRCVEVRWCGDSRATVGPYMRC